MTARTSLLRLRLGNGKRRVSSRTLSRTRSRAAASSRSDERFVDQVGDLEHFFFFHPARGDGGRADADAAGFEDRVGVEGNSVLVHGDAGAIENFLRLLCR